MNRTGTMTDADKHSVISKIIAGNFVTDRSNGGYRCMQAEIAIVDDYGMNPGRMVVDGLLDIIEHNTHMLYIHFAGASADWKLANLHVLNQWRISLINRGLDFCEGVSIPWAEMPIGCIHAQGTEKLK